MSALAVLQTCRALGVVLTATADGGLRYKAPRGTVPPALRDAMHQHKAALRALVEAAGSASALPEPPGATHYHSAVLGTDFWVCEDAAQAETLRAEGQVAYTAAEVWLLRDLKKRDPEGFPDKLQTLHQVKAVLGVTLDARDPATTGKPAMPVPVLTAVPCLHQWTPGAVAHTAICQRCGLTTPIKPTHTTERG